MPYYLTIDIGNSSAKAALWHDQELAMPAIWGALTPDDITQLCDTAHGKVTCAAVCTVTDDMRGLDAAAERHSKKQIWVSASTSTPINLNCYGTLATLGADRIAALCGAQALCPGSELLVVDCGTAVTYDRLSADGTFVGGNIAPGLGMRLRALHAFTARLPVVETNTATDLWGRSTAEAMQAGAIYGVVGETLYYMSQMPKGAQLVLTGGRSRDVAGKLSIDCIVDTDLVLRGLKHIIAYNENK